MSKRENVPVLMYGVDYGHDDSACEVRGYMRPDGTVVIASVKHIPAPRKRKAKVKRG